MMVPENLEETIMNLRANDAQCQKMLEKSIALSREYFRVLESLNPADRDCVQQYHDLCEDLEDRTVALVAAHYAACGAASYMKTEF